MVRKITVAQKDMYMLNLNQAEIFLLISGLMPYISLKSDPMIPENEFLWIHQSEKSTDQFSTLDPFPCYVNPTTMIFNDMYILTLWPTAIDREFLTYVDNMKKLISIRKEIIMTRSQIVSTIKTLSNLERYKRKY